MTRCATRKLFSLFGLFVVLRIIAFSFSKNYDGDAVIRIWMGADWLRDPFFVYHANPVTWVFGPLQYYLMALALSIWDNLLYSPRLVNLILGTLSIIPFYGIVRNRFGEKVGVYAALLFSFYSLHIKYSTVATSEVIYAFVILSAVYCFFQYERARKSIWLLATAAFINLAAMCRHETPMYAGLLVLMLLIIHRKDPFWKNLSRAAVFGALCLLFTALWYMGDYLHQGDPLYSVHIASSDHLGGIQGNIVTRGSLRNLLYNLLFWPTVIFLSFSPVVAVFAFLGLMRSLVTRKSIDLALLFLIPFLVFNYQSTIGAAMTPLARLATTFSIFLLPLAASEWHRISSLLKGGKGRMFDYVVTASIVLSVTLLAVFGVEGRGYIPDKLSSVSPLSRLPYYVEEILDWTDSNVDPGDRVVIDSYGFQADVIYFYSKLPKENLKIRWQNDSEILTYMKVDKPRFVVYSPDGRLARLLNLTPQDSVQVRQQLRFALRLATLHYQIYELTEISPDTTFEVTLLP